MSVLCIMFLKIAEIFTKNGGTLLCIRMPSLNTAILLGKKNNLFEQHFLSSGKNVCIFF